MADWTQITCPVCHKPSGRSRSLPDDVRKEIYRPYEDGGHAERLTPVQGSKLRRELTELIESGATEGRASE